MFISLNHIRRMSAQNPQDESDMEESQFQPKLSHREPKQSKEKFSEFTTNLGKMQNFIEEITQKRVGIENNVIYNFCGQYEKMPIPPIKVISLLGKRIERMMKNKKIKKNWSEEDLYILIWTTTYYAELHKIQQIELMTQANWNQISELIPGTTGESCMFKILGLKKVKLSEQSWTAQESNLLFQIVKNSEDVDWKKASQELFVKNKTRDRVFRSSKQCKEHWSCYLNPHLKKGPWTIDQDIHLLDNILQNNGKKRWTQLAKIFQCRTENALKNRFCLLVDKQKSNKNQPQEESDQVIEILALLRQQRKNLVKLNVLKDDPRLTPQIQRVPPLPNNNVSQKNQKKTQKHKEIQTQRQRKKKFQQNEDYQFNLDRNIQHKSDHQLFKNNYKINLTLQPQVNQPNEHLKTKQKKPVPRIKQSQVSCINNLKELREIKSIQPTSLKMQAQCNSNVKIQAIEPTRPAQTFQIKYPVYNMQTTNFYQPFFYSFVMYNPMLQ